MDRLNTEEFQRLFELEIALLEQEKENVKADKERVTESRLRKIQELYAKIHNPNWDQKLTAEELELAEELYLRQKKKVDSFFGEGVNKEFAIRKAIISYPCEFEAREIDDKLKDPTYAASQEAKVGLLLTDIHALNGVIYMPVIIRFQNATDEEIENERKRLLSEQESKMASLNSRKSVIEAELSSFESEENRLISGYMTAKSPDEKKALLSQIDQLRKAKISNTEELSKVKTDIEELKIETKRLESLSIDELKRELSYNLIKKMDFSKSNAAAYISGASKHDAEESMRRYEYNFSSRYEQMNDIYERVHKNGVNPTNYVFASVAGNEYRTNEILPLAEKYQRLMEKKKGIGTPRYNEHDFGNLFYRAFGNTVSSAAEDMSVTAKDTPLFWEWLGVDREAPVDAVVVSIEAKIEELKKIDEKVEEKYPNPSAGRNSDSKGIESIDFDYLTSLIPLKPFFENDDEYEITGEKIRKCMDLRKKIDKIPFGFASRELETLGSLEQIIRSKVHVATEKYNKAKRRELIEERMGAFAEDQALKEPFENAGLLGLAAYGTVDHPLPSAVASPTSLYEDMLAEFMVKAREIREKNAIDHKDVDGKIDEAKKEISYTTGLDLSDWEGDLFPKPIDKPRQDEPWYIANDVTRAYQTYNLESRVKRAIEKAEYTPEEELEAQQVK